MIQIRRRDREEYHGGPPFRKHDNAVREVRVEGREARDESQPLPRSGSRSGLKGGKLSANHARGNSKVAVGLKAGRIALNHSRGVRS